MTGIVRLGAASLAAALAIAIGVAAAWPIYQTALLVIPAVAGHICGTTIAALSARLRWGLLTTAAALALTFVITVVPIAVPSAMKQLPEGLLPGLNDGLAATVLGWKQLLTLTLPVGSYQSTLVPAYLVFVLTSFAIALIALRAPRYSPVAAVMLAIPVTFGTVFGASQVSASLMLGPLTLRAPRETMLWLLAATLAAAWVWWAAGIERRSALRKGRGESSGGSTIGPMARFGAAAVTVLLGLTAATLAAPVIDASAREVPRDYVSPEVIVRAQASPLASFRAFKSDEAIDRPVFEVEADGQLPRRLRLAVLDAYDGVDFHVSSEHAGAFTRFPSGGTVADPVEVSVQINDGYAGIWAPTADLGSAPEFFGPRAINLADSFYVNRDTGAAIALPGRSENAPAVGAGMAATHTSGDLGLRAGDGYRAVMSAANDPELTGGPNTEASRLDLDALPELVAWVEAQQQPNNARGLIELIERLRSRGYLSHGMADGRGADGSDPLWLQRLAAEYGTTFESSPGGHSVARIEQMFAQLNTQQRLAGDDAPVEALVAAVGDDEQFAAAAALIARSIGFESRIVVGVRLGEPETAGVPGTLACSDVCTGEHLAAWIEVRGDSFEWAPIDVTPQATVRPVALEEGEQLPEFVTLPDERDAKEVDPPLGVGERSDEAPPTETPTEGLTLWPYVRVGLLLIGALVLLALPLLFLPLAKRARARARRRQLDPEIRALGAWNEMVDRALDAGVDIPTGASRGDIADILNTAPARWAAREVDRAVFSPSGISDADADWVWAAAEADRAEREVTLTGAQRLRTAYRLRSYRATHTTKRGRARRSTHV